MDEQVQKLNFWFAILKRFSWIISSRNKFHFNEMPLISLFLDFINSSPDSLIFRYTCLQCFMFLSSSFLCNNKCCASFEFQAAAIKKREWTIIIMWTYASSWNFNCWGQFCLLLLLRMKNLHKTFNLQRVLHAITMTNLNTIK